MKAFHSSKCVYLFGQQVFIDCLPCAWKCDSYWERIAKQNRPSVRVPCSLVEDTNINEIVPEPNVGLVFSATTEECMAQ